MTQLSGGPIGPDGLGGAYPNDLFIDSATIWHALGGRAGLVHGDVSAFEGSGSMTVDFPAFVALVPSRYNTTDPVPDQGYAVMSSGGLVPFPSGSPGARNDALVLAIVDPIDGLDGTGGLAAGAHIVVVPGQSGVTTPRSAAQIQAFVGSGGWLRLFDVPIPANATSVDMTAASFKAIKLNDWNDFTFTVGSGWSFSRRRYVFQRGTIHVEMAATYSGPTITASSVDGNIVGDPVFGTGWPSFLTTDVSFYSQFERDGVVMGSWRVSAAGNASLTDAYPGAQIASGAGITFRAVYFIPLP